VEGALELRTRVMTGSIRDWSRVRMPGSLISCALLSCRGEHGGQSSQLSRTEPNRAHTDTESERIKGDNRDMTLPTVRQLLLLCFFGFFGCWSSTGGYPSVFHKAEWTVYVGNIIEAGMFSVIITLKQRASLLLDEIICLGNCAL